MHKNGQLPLICSKQKKKKNSPVQIINTSISSSFSCSSVSIDPPKGCLRFFSKKSPNLCNPSLKSAPNQKPISRSTNPNKENVSKTKSSCRIGKKPEKSVSKTGSERLSSMCSTKSLRNKNKIFTPVVKNGKSFDSTELLKEREFGVDRVGKLASGSVLKLELGKRNSRGASSGCSEKNPNQKQVIYDESRIDFVEKCTPMNRIDKGETVFATSSTTSTKTTPPVQASVSPEINCASSSSVLAVSAAKTPTCYGAGHIVSGVTDRRKCRARGILTVGQKDSSFTNLDKFENSDDFGVVRKSRTSLVPFPEEASMHWLLSPCEEVDEDSRTNRSPGHRNVSDLCNVFDSSSSGNTSGARRSKIILLSPSRSPRLEGISGDSSGKMGVFPLSASPSCEMVVSNAVRKNRYDQIMESSPFSSGSLGSGNVIRTPQSESSSDRHVGMSCLNTSEKKIFDFGYDIDCATEDLLRASLSPKTNRSVWNSSGFSFHLPEVVSPSDSCDLSHLPNAWSKGSSLISNSRSNDMSSSQMRVSWRDGLASRIFEMDESDFCRCLSDDENDANKSSNSKFKSSLSHEMKYDMCESENCEKGIISLEYVGHAPKHDGEREEEFDVKRYNPCEESICTDGGELAASGDSDWTSCYKNHLFDL